MVQYHIFDNVYLDSGDTCCIFNASKCNITNIGQASHIDYIHQRGIKRTERLVLILHSAYHHIRLYIIYIQTHIIQLSPMAHITNLDIPQTYIIHNTCRYEELACNQNIIIRPIFDIVILIFSEFRQNVLQKLIIRRGVSP